MLALIRAIHAELKDSYGSPRMVRELRARGFPASKERGERLMRENDIRARRKRRFKATTDSKHALGTFRLPRDHTHLKNERVHCTRYSTWAEAMTDLFDYIAPFYNGKRKHSTLGYASPKKFLEDWISAQHEEKLAAQCRWVGRRKTEGSSNSLV